MLSLPVGTGVRVDAGLRVGDVADAVHDPVIATVTSWGRDRAQALARLRRALERTSVVLSGGATNRTGLIAILGAAAVLDGPPHPQWYARQLASGALVPDRDPVAVVAAAIEVYEADLALVQRSFRASAERGRPEHPERVGVAIDLGYRGGRYRLRVDRTAPDRYRVHGGVRLDVVVDSLSPFERRMLVAGRTRRVVAVTEGDAVRLEIDGVAHTVTREDGVVVRAPAPALVCSLLVGVGDRVTAGQPVATLESMKMLSTLTAPLPEPSPRSLSCQTSRSSRGTRSCGSSRPRSPACCPTCPAGRTRRRSTSPRSSWTTTRPCRPTSSTTSRHTCSGSTSTRRPPGRCAPPTALSRRRAARRTRTLLAREDAFLDLFADIGSLYRPRTEAEALGDADDVDQGSTQEYVLEFLRWLDADRAGLPARYQRRLERVLARYGVEGIGDRGRLERATFWLFRAFSRVPELADVVTEVLGRRLEHAGQLLGQATAADRTRLERLVRATQGRQPAVTDAARDVVYHWFEEPVLSRVVAETEAEMRDHLAELAADPAGPDRADRIGRLVWCPQPMRSLLLGAWLGARENGTAGGITRCGHRRIGRRVDRGGPRRGGRRGRRRGRPGHGVPPGAARDLPPPLLPDARPARARLRRPRRPRPRLRPLRARRPAGARRDRVPPGRRPHQGVPGHRPAPRRARRGPRRRRRPRRVAAGFPPEIDVTAADAAGLLAECDFGRPLHRLDLTITSLEGGGPERDRTQHVTFRSDPAGAGFVEDTIYRNLHPMLGKRLDLWRLSNFELTRLPSPEDVYVFDGVAKDNPRDHRLFALAEVRDLTPVRDPSTGRVTYPRLGRSGLAALAVDAQRDGPLPLPGATRRQPARGLGAADLAHPAGGVAPPRDDLRGPGPRRQPREGRPARHHPGDRPSRPAGLRGPDRRARGARCRGPDDPDAEPGPEPGAHPHAVRPEGPHREPLRHPVPLRDHPDADPGRGRRLAVPARQLPGARPRRRRRAASPSTGSRAATRPTSSSGCSPTAPRSTPTG